MTDTPPTSPVDTSMPGPTGNDDQWWIGGNDGERYGPYDLERMISFAREGRIAVNTSIYPPVGGQWLPARSCAEIFPHIGRAVNQSNDGLGFVIPVEMPVTIFIAGWCAMLGVLVLPLGLVAVVLGGIGLATNSNLNGHAKFRAIGSIVLGAIELAAAVALVLYFAFNA